jgi:acetyl esterase/lipase
MSNHADELGVDRSRIAIGGASAGGGLTAGLALLARDRAETDVAFQMLVYPMIDDCNIAPASEKLPDTLIWSRAKNLFGWTSYLGREPGGDDVPYTAAASRATDVSGLPPAIIVVGDLDLFVDENIEYSRRLIQAGVPTELHVYPGAYHGFNGFVPGATISRQCNAACNQALKKALYQ